METKEQLCKELFVCTHDYIQAHNKVSTILQRGYETQGKDTNFKLTKELLPDFSIALEDERRAIVKLQEISSKLSELSQ